MLKYRYTACQQNTKEQIIKMVINGSGIRDTARVLNIHKNTIINTLKKAGCLVQVNPNLIQQGNLDEITIRLEPAFEAELDEQSLMSQTSVHDKK